MILSAAQKRDLLARLPLFAGLAPRELDALAAVARTRPLGDREALFHKGDPGTQVYAVVSGTLKVVTSSEAGDDVVLNLLGPGDVIGEIAALCDSERTAAVVALGECVLLVVDRRDLVAFLRSHPDASLALMTVLARRLRNLSELVEDTLFLNLPVRLAKKLLSQVERHGRRTPEGVRIELRLSQEEWGDLVGATRESINKQMRAWTDQGLIRVEQGCVVILREDALRALAQSPAG
jgi:CRP-like cAMP-binding protein